MLLKLLLKEFLTFFLPLCPARCLCQFLVNEVRCTAFFIKPLNFCNFGPRPCLYLLRPWSCLYLRGLPPAPLNTSDCMMFYLLLPSNPNSNGAVTEAAKKPNAPLVLYLLLPRPLTNFSRGGYSVFRGNPAP